MVPDGNMNLHKGMKRPRNSKYTILFSYFKISLKDNWMFKAKIRTIYGDTHNIWRSKMYGNNSTKAKGKGAGP